MDADEVDEQNSRDDTVDLALVACSIFYQPGNEVILKKYVSCLYDYAWGEILTGFSCQSFPCSAKSLSLVSIDRPMVFRPTWMLRW